MSVTVELTDSEYLHALIAGCMRRVAARQAGRKNYYGADAADAELLDILGAVGEACVAKHLGLFWLGAGQFRGDDVGIYQVRSTKYESGHLVLNKADAPDKVFILVTVNCGVGKLRGWVWAKDGQQERYWQDKSGRGGAFYVPQSDLLSMAELPGRDF